MEMNYNALLILVSPVVLLSGRWSAFDLAALVDPVALPDPGVAAVVVLVPAPVDLFKIKDKRRWFLSISILQLVY